MHPPRWIEMDACSNFRDAGDYPTMEGRRVRSGLLYRSGSPARMTERDVTLARDQLGIKTVIDLRTEDEVEAVGLGPFVGHPEMTVLTIPTGRAAAEGVDGLPDLSDGLGALYVYGAQRNATAIANVLLAVAAHCHEPLVVCCAGGKDRTGVAIALLLDVLGVSEELIVEDYALTERNLERIPEADRAALARELGASGWPETILHAAPESMRHFLAWIRDEHGSTAGFLAAHDAAAAIPALKAALLE